LKTRAYRRQTDPSMELVSVGPLQLQRFVSRSTDESGGGCASVSHFSPAGGCKRVREGPPFIVARVLAQQLLRLAVVPDEQVIEAVAPKRAANALAERVGSRRSRRRKELSDTEAR
jgi:hypothetical protein